MYSCNQFEASNCQRLGHALNLMIDFADYIDPKVRGRVGCGHDDDHDFFFSLVNLSAADHFLLVTSAGVFAC